MGAKRTVLLHSDNLKKEEKEQLDSLLESHEPSFISLSDFKTDADDSGTLVLTYLNDEELRGLIPKVSEKDITLAVLPHPDGFQSRVGYGVDAKLNEAVMHLNTSPDTVTVDSMFCNERLVFNNVVIGDTFQLATTGRTATAPWWKRFRYVIGRFWTLRPFRVSVETPNKEIDTVVSGIVVVQHGKGSMLSRLILENSFANDNRFHAILISPRSLSQLVLFALRSIFIRKRLPPFAAHIKTNEIRFKAQESFDFSEDGVSQSAKEIEIKVVPAQVRMIPGRHIKTQSEGGEASDIFKVSQLPMKDSAKVMAGKKLPFIKHASTEEFQALFTVLRNNAEVKTSYLVLMILSTTLAAFGIFSNSTPVVIGAMILAPLMAPIISLSMATLRQDNQLAINSAKSILAGLLAGFICAVLLTFITPITSPNNEILSRIRPNLLDLGIAVLSGVAGAYAHAREEIAKTLAGVAIAVALVPPLAVSAIGLAWWDREIFLGAFLLLMTNLAGMVLAGAVTFLVMGYSPFKLARKGVLLSLVFVGILSLPLGLSFQRMVQEHNIVEKIESLKYEEYEVKEARVVRLNPLTVGITVTADHNLSEDELDELKKSLEKSLDREIDLEITVAIKR